MKRLLTFLPFIIPFVIIVVAFGTAITWRPTDVDAALSWNLAIILAPAFALLVQYKAALERKMPIVLTLTVVAILNTAIVLGSRLGAWHGADWLRALSGEGLPDLPGKTVMGGLVLMLAVYLVLRRWWRLPPGLPDVLILGLPLAATVGRIGCLGAGCCYGIPTGSDWGIGFGSGTPAFLHHAQSGLLAEGATSPPLLFPVQLFFIAGNLLIFAFLWHFRNRFARPGALAFLGLALLMSQRFGIEFVRDVATNRGAFGAMWSGLKSGQWVMLLLVAGSIAGFLFLHFSKKKNARNPLRNSQTAGAAPQAYALGGITLGGLLLRDLLTLEEAMVILISCAPAVVMLGRQLWREHHSGRPVWAPASLLSATALALMLNPVDTIVPEQNPKEWKQWMEVGAGGSFGSYKKINRDCDGNVTSTDKIKTNSGGGEIRSVWQRNETKLQVSLRGTFGNAETNDNNDGDSNYSYSSLGVIGRVEYDWIGLSLGLFNRQRKFPAKVNSTYHQPNEFLPSGSIRIGLPDRFSFDFRLYDEPVLGFSNEPPFSFGFANWGFNDPSGNSLLRAGFAVTSLSEGSFHLSGQFPFGKSGLNGGFSAYIGNANMVGVGLRYRFKER